VEVAYLLSSFSQTTAQAINHYEAMAQLKKAILSAQTLDELYVLMEDYSYLEFIQIYNQLMPKQQAAIDAICDRDNQKQMAAIHALKTATSAYYPLTSAMTGTVESAKSR
jgi:hypothetical protein